ncbi:hypothetical protein [Thalassobacillus sp. CUG 92003]|uniref:hypothetical protein n=1 Tax=Thalassobacillus sp. CUG 92003 TaxID=2736641 RepID=UPI0015E6CC62|nr:hypothetical protein [Thalassobacillus sp. CUG 92003]
MAKKQPENKRKVKSDNWRDLPLAEWNCRTFTAYLTSLTAEQFGVDYEPTGGGAKAERWRRELGMMKTAQANYGNAVLKRFIEKCVTEYTPKAEYPYASFSFMYSYMSDKFPKAQAEVAAEQRAEAKRKEDEVEAAEFDAGEYEDWL